MMITKTAGAPFGLTTKSSQRNVHMSLSEMFFNETGLSNYQGMEALARHKICWGGVEVDPLNVTPEEERIVTMGNRPKHMTV